MNIKTLTTGALLALSSFTSGTSGASPAVSQLDPVRVYLMNCGHFEFKDMAIFSDTGDYEGKSGTLADPCVLVQHPKGWILWDTGLGDGFVGHPLEVKEIHATLSVGQSIVSQLAKLQLKPSDIAFVAFSHTHSDHTGNANLFTSATWLMQEKELQYALSKPTPPYIDPKSFSNYKTVKMNLLHGDYDVFGDGRVMILSTPGHTPGHQSLMVQLKEEGTVIFGGDLFHTRENYDHTRVPVGNSSRAETLASIDRIEKLVKAKHAKLMIQHDFNDMNQYPKFPEPMK